VEIGQGEYGPFGVLAAPAQEKAHTDAAKLAQDPRGVAMAYAPTLRSADPEEHCRAVARLATLGT